MINQFKSEIQSIGIVPNTKIYLAISGGVDSIVLSNLLLEAKIDHSLLHCNFKLRGQESDEDEQFVINYAKQHSLEFHTTSFQTKQVSRGLKLTTQECARNLRYDWFATFLNQSDSILLTAHHLDDSIETFFINLLRGTGLKGLSGIPSGQNKIYRPLLIFSKSQIKSYAFENKINFRTDSSNESEDYLRNNLRHNLIPELKNLTTNFESKAATLFAELDETSQFIEEFLIKYKTEVNATNKIKIAVLEAIPQFMWYKLFSNYGLSRIHNNELIKLVQSTTGSVFKSKTHIILKDRDSLIINKDENRKPISITISDISKPINLINSKLTFEEVLVNSKTINFKTNFAILDFHKITFPITIRNWKIGDKIIPFGFKSHKLVSKVLTDKKQNKFQKQNQLIIESNGEILWLIDLMVSNQFAITSKTRKIIKIEHIQY